jgi:anthranilate synthase component 1
MGKTQLPRIKIGQKPTYIKFAEDVDFFELFKKIESEYDSCYLLESLGEEGKVSRYSIIGFSPSHIIRAEDTSFYVDDKKYTVENPYYALREMMPQNVISRNYAGGLIGYMSYEAMNYFEPSLSLKNHHQFETFMFGVYKDGLVLDKMTNELFYFFYEENRLEEIKSIMKKKITIKKPVVNFKGDTLSQKEHKEIVENVKEEILQGNTFQCQVGFKRKFSIKGNALPIYEKLRDINPSPFMYFMKFGKKKIIGASPELLFKMSDKFMETYPLAGTTRRGKTALEDTKLARTLLNDPKERAEHNMLVDLHRNDIGRVASFGSVKVQSLMDIKKYSHVQHISSEIAGILKDGEDMFTALASNFPAGTLTGAPKIESMKIIDRNEMEARGPYGGALGEFGFNGNCIFAIPIRTLFIDGDNAYTQASGGIVYDSTPQNEYDEVQRKMGAITQVLEFFYK